MPFLAQCPFCPTKVRVPSEAIGTSIPCPQCRNHFTLAPITEINIQSDPQYLSARLGRALATEAQAKSPAPLPEPTDTPGPSQPPRTLPPSPAVATPPVNPWGVACFVAAALALLTASGPALYDLLRVPIVGVAVLTTPLSIVAVLLALVGAFAWQEWNGRSLFLTAAGGGLGLIVLMLAVFWPSIFGTSFVLRGYAVVDPSGPVLIQQLQKSSDAGWVDAAAGAVQSGPAQVQAFTPTIEQVQLVGAKRSDWSKLVIRLQVANVASGHPLTYAGWGSVHDGKALEPILTDARGKALKFCQRMPDGEIRNRAARSVVVPGRKLDDVLIFELPPANCEGLLLELPAAAWGGEGSVKLRLTCPSR